MIELPPKLGRTCKTILLLVPLFLSHIPSIFARDVTLQWRPNSEPDLAGYRVFHRVEGQVYDYESPAWEGTATTCTIYNLDENSVNCFVARAYDTEGFESVDSDEACKLPEIDSNQPPTANAGADQTVDAGNLVFLNGSGSVDIDDGIATYTWHQIEGPGVTLSDPSIPQPSFSAPEVTPDGVSLTFGLDVVDHSGLQDSDTCIVNITFQNQPPVAIVAQSYLETIEGAMVLLDGSDSIDNDDGIAEYLWTQVEGDPVELSDPVSAWTWFSAPETDQFGSNLVFNLIVTDVGGLQSSAETVVYVLPNDDNNNDNVEENIDDNVMEDADEGDVVEGVDDNDGADDVDDYESNGAFDSSNAKQGNATACFIGTGWH